MAGGTSHREAGSLPAPSGATSPEAFGTATAKDAATWSFEIVLRSKTDRSELAREPVTEQDLLEARSEAWLECVLRRGSPEVPIDELTTRVVPLPAADRFRCTGYAIDTMAPGGEPRRHVFSVSSLEPVAARASQRLLERGILQDGDTYLFDLRARPTEHDGPPATPGGASFGVASHTHVPVVLRLPMSPLLEKAAAVGTLDGEAWKVFYTADALHRSEQFSRQGAAFDPPVETGAVLIGALCTDTESGDFFVVVFDVLEVTDALKEPFSLTYSGKTWSRIQAVLKARRARDATKAHRILGQAHGHNFLPADGAPPCAMCSEVEVCGRTSVFVSTDDAAWTRAVFPRQPWRLTHIYGLNAREEQVQGLFTLHDGRFRQRGYHVIPHFDAEGV